MILLKMLPDQIMRHWSFVKDCIVASAPPGFNNDPDAMIRLQESLLLEQAQCWAAAEDLGSNTIYGTMITKCVYDECTGVKNLLIFSVCITSLHPPTLWKDSYESLRAFASAQGCKSILSFTNQDKVVEIAQSLGADVSWRLIQLSV